MSNPLIKLENPELLNRNFVMTFRKSTEALLDLGVLDPTARVVLEFLIMHMDTENCLIVSYGVMAERLNCTERTIQSKIKLLHDHQFIDIFKSGTSNIYAVNAEICWATHANKRKYAKFSARVMISQTEQSQTRKSRTTRLDPQPSTD